MSANATERQVSAVLQALGQSQLLDTVLTVKWAEAGAATVDYAALEYELSAPREALVEALTAYLNG